MMMPTVFVGHGSPMNALEDNPITQTWKTLGLLLPRPKGILAISAHWYTQGTRTTDQSEPPTIHDMYGFPKPLYTINYKAPGSPQLAQDLLTLFSKALTIDNSWGIDHGTWSVLTHMYPEADIPVIQLSVDALAPQSTHYQMGQALQVLRNQGILIFASGNVVHHLGKLDWKAEGGYPWAHDFDGYIKNAIFERDHGAIIDYEAAGQSAKEAFPTPDHFYPLLYALGASNVEDPITIFNEVFQMGSLSMTSYLFGMDLHQQLNPATTHDKEDL